MRTKSIIIIIVAALLLPLAVSAQDKPLQRPPKKTNTTPTRNNRPTQPVVTETPVQPVDYGCCPDGNHPHAIDLGLPSGTKWACCNVGASQPEGYGDYYAWGETSTKSTYSWDNYKWCNGAYNKLTKYNPNSNFGIVDNRTQLEQGDDVAYTSWGGLWRMPTSVQCDELINNTTHEWTAVNDVVGRKFMAANGNYVFLPAGGWRSVDVLGEFGVYGGYWSSSLAGSSYGSFSACHFNVGSGVAFTGFNQRSDGRSVRPVRGN